MRKILFTDSTMNLGHLRGGIYYCCHVFLFETNTTKPEMLHLKPLFTIFSPSIEFFKVNSPIRVFEVRKEQNYLPYSRA